MKNILYILLVVFSCCKKTDKSDSFFSNIKNITGEIMNIDCLIGKSADLTCNDTRLFIYDQFEKNALTIVDTKNNT